MRKETSIYTHANEFLAKVEGSISSLRQDLFQVNSAMDKISIWNGRQYVTSDLFKSKMIIESKLDRLFHLLHSIIFSISDYASHSFSNSNANEIFLNQLKDFEIQYIEIMKDNSY